MQLHQVAARPFARSVLAARSSPLSSGAIAGAVVGSFVGVLLIALCLFPFIVRARRSRLGRHGDPSLAEMGQSPGGLIYAPQDLDDSSSKRFSKDHLVPGAEPSLEDGADHGAVTATPDHKPPNSTLPSPVSPSPSPTRVSLTSAAVQVQSPTNPSHPRYGSKGTLGRESSDSYYAHPSRELTAITSAGITEEPEPFAEHGHFPHLRESLRNLLHHRHSSHRNHDSRDSTQGAAEGPRSPSLATTDILPQPGLTPSDLEIDPETRGLAWDYYHPEPSDAYPQSAPTPISASIAPLSIAPTSGPAAGVGVPSSMTTRPAVGELDAISPDSDKTVTPASFSRQSTFGLGRKQPGPLQRTDSLPAPTIVADIPSPPLLHYDIGPSGNPMEMMRPTNPAESAWMLEHEIRKIETSPPPPPPLLDPVPSTSIPPDEAICGMPERDPIVKHESPYPSSDFPPYPSPSQGPAEPGAQIVGEPPDYYVTSDYATPGFSTGASTEHTPDTRLTPYTASPSPSPPSDADAPNNGQSLPLPGLPRGLSRTPSPSPSSSGPSPVTSPGQPAGPSPERSPARPPGGFVCPSCGSRKQSWHQLNHHQRYHKRPFPCKHPGCELSFGTITHLNRHINDRHQKTRGYHCTQPGCAWSRQGGKSFARKDNWKRHMRNAHGVSGVETEEENLDDLLAADVAMSGT